MQHGNREMCRRSEAEEADAFSGLDSCYAEATKSDDARAKQRRGVQVVNGIRKWINEVGEGDGVLCIAAGDCVASELDRIAKVLFSAAAVRTRAVSASKPRDSYARAERDVGRGSGGDFTYDLMAGNHLRMLWREFSFDDVEISAADAAGADLEEDVAWRDFGIRDVGDFQWAFRDRVRIDEDCGFHKASAAVDMMTENERWFSHATLALSG